MAEPYVVCTRSLILYIYIYTLFVDPCDAWKQIIIHLPKIELQERIKNQERE